MNARSIILLCIALITGTILAFGTKKILNAIPDQEQAAAVSSLKTVPVMVAKQDIHFGDELTPQNVRFDRLPEDEVPADVINNFRDAKHRFVKKDLVKGNLISVYDLNDPKENETKRGDYVPLNSSLVSFLIRTVTKHGEEVKGDLSLNSIKESITPDIDKVDFVLTYEKKDEKDLNGTHQRVSSTETILSDVVVRGVKMASSQETSDGTADVFLKLSFVINKESLSVLEEACKRGKVTISLLPQEMQDSVADASFINPVFLGDSVESASSRPISAGYSSDSFFNSGASRTETGDDIEPVGGTKVDDSRDEEENNVPVLFKQEDQPNKATESVAAPGMSVPRVSGETSTVTSDTQPRMSIPRPNSVM